MDLFSWLFGKKAAKADPQDDFSFIAFRPPPPPAQPLKPELMAYVSRLCALHGKVGSFASGETRTIGQEIWEAHGHNGMVDVCDTVRLKIGAGPARDLEYKWNGIGDWMG
jgi:hypothetical protein